MSTPTTSSVFGLASAEPWFGELIYWESFIFQLFSLIFSVICLLCSVRYCRHGRSQWSPFHGLALAQSVIALISDVTELMAVGQQDCSAFGLASLLLSHSQATMHTFLMLARLRVFRHVSSVPDRFRSILQWGIPVVYIIIEIATLTDACNNSTSLADFQDRRTMFTIWRVFSALVNLSAAMSMYLSLARIRRAQRYPNMASAIELDTRMARAQWHIQWSACTIPVELVIVFVASRYPPLSSAISAALLRLLLLGQIMMLSAVNKVMAYVYLYAAAKGSSNGSGVTEASAVASKMLSSTMSSKLPNASTKSSAGVPKIQSLASNPILNGANQPQPANAAHHDPTHQSPSLVTGSPVYVNIQYSTHQNNTPGSSSNCSLSAEDVAVQKSNLGLRAGPRLLWALSTVGLSNFAKGSLPGLSSGSVGPIPQPTAPAPPSFSAVALPSSSTANHNPQSRANLHPGSAIVTPPAGSSPPKSAEPAPSSIPPATVSTRRRGSAASITARTNASRLSISAHSSHALPGAHHDPTESTTPMRHMGGPVARHPSIPITLSEATTTRPALHTHLEQIPAHNISMSLRSTGASLAATSAFETASSTHSRPTSSATDSHVLALASNVHVIAPSNTPSRGSTNLFTAMSSASSSAAMLTAAATSRGSADNTYSTKPTGSQATAGFVSFRTAPGGVSSSKSLAPEDPGARVASGVASASSWLVAGAPGTPASAQVGSSHSLQVLATVAVGGNVPEMEELPPSRDE